LTTVFLNVSAAALKSHSGEEGFYMAFDLAALSNTRICRPSTNMLQSTKRNIVVTANAVVVKVYVKANPMWNDCSYSAVVQTVMV
jgi:hypothetical protein